MALDFKSLPKFCITLLRSEDRRKRVSAEFTYNKIDAKWFYAVDKNNLELPENIKIPKGAYACWLSHKNLMKFALRNDYPEIVVFEDDVKLCRDFWERMHYIENLNLDFDIFMLGGHFSGENTMNQESEITEYNFIHRIIGMAGTYAYIIRKPAYEFLINGTYEKPIDGFFFDKFLRNFKSYTFIPCLASCFACKSEINDEFIKYPQTTWYYEDKRIMR